MEWILNGLDHRLDQKTWIFCPPLENRDVKQKSRNI